MSNFKILIETMYALLQKNTPQEHPRNFIALLRPQVKHAALDHVETFKQVK